MRSKRSRQRAAKPTRGYGSKKKHRGSGHRGGVGLSSIGKRSSAKKMKITKGDKFYLGKYGFKSVKKKIKSITLQSIQERLKSLLHEGKISKDGDSYVIDIKELGYGKLLSKGSVAVKMIIKAGFATENAAKKVEAAGGKVELNNKE